MCRVYEQNLEESKLAGPKISKGLLTIDTVQVGDMPATAVRYA